MSTSRSPVFTANTFTWSVDLSVGWKSDKKDSVAVRFTRFWPERLRWESNCAIAHNGDLELSETEPIAAWHLAFLRLVRELGTASTEYHPTEANHSTPVAARKSRRSSDIFSSRERC